MIKAYKVEPVVLVQVLGESFPPPHRIMSRSPFLSVLALAIASKHVWCDEVLPDCCRLGHLESRLFRGISGNASNIPNTCLS